MFGSTCHPLVITLLFLASIPLTARAQAVEVELPDVSGVPGETFDIQLSADFDDEAGEVLSYDFKLTYDPSKLIITAVEDPVDRFDNFLRNLTKSEAGEVTFAAAAISGVDPGVLVEISLTLRDYTAPTTPLTLTGSFGLITNDGEEYVPVEMAATVTVAEPNQAPEAVDDQAEVTEGESVLIDVLQNDSDPDGDELQITEVTDPDNGTAVVESEAILYTPDAAFVGEDAFSYTISDGRGGESTATVTVLVVEAPNLPPQFASPLFIQPTDGATVTVGGTGSDPGDPASMLVFEWNEATDPEGEEISYEWEISANADFESVLAGYSTTSTSIEVSHETVAGWLDDLAVPALGSISLYHRLTAGDGVTDVVSTAASVVITRGVFVGIDNGLTSTFALAQNYPNPFNPSTTIEYSVPASGHVTLSVYDALGKEVARLVDGPEAAGTRVVRFDASELSSGIYVYRLSTGDHAMTRSMLLVK